MYDVLLKYSCIFTSVFALIAMFIMIYFASSKEVIYSKNISLQENKISQEGNMIIEGTKIKLAVSHLDDETADFAMSLGPEIVYENIVIKNDYLNQVLYLQIKGLEENFFETNQVSGKEQFINAVFYQFSNGITNIEVQLTDVYEYSIILKNSKLFFEFKDPRSVYDKIVVIDVVENRITNKSYEEIGEIIKILLEEYGIFGYYLGVDYNQTDEKIKADVINSLNADMLISIEIINNLNANELESSEGIKAIYNPSYFIPYFSSIQLSDMIERNVAQATNLYAIGLEPANEKDILIMESEIPVTRIEIYDEYKDGKESLEIEAYYNQIAKGIVNGIVESYDYIEEEEK